MYKIKAYDYISVLDSNDNEVLHIELDCRMEDIIDKIESFVKIVNDNSIESILKNSDKDCQCLEGYKSFIGNKEVFTCYSCGGQFLVN